MEVKILVYTTPLSLEKAIVLHFSRGFNLKGSVTVGVNQQGNTIYVATMVKEG